MSASKMLLESLAEQSYKTKRRPEGLLFALDMRTNPKVVRVYAVYSAASSASPSAAAFSASAAFFFAAAFSAFCVAARFLSLAF